MVKQMSQKYIDLDNIPNNEQVITYEDGQNKIIEVQKLNPHNGKWETEYKKAYDKYSISDVQTHFWDAINKKTLVISNSAGSGSFLSYIVMDRVNGRLNTLIQRQGIFQGQVWFEGNNLIEGEGNRYEKWEFIDGKFILMPFNLPIFPGAKVIRYSISPKGAVTVFNNVLRANIGDIIQLIRVDNNDVVERILFTEGSQAINFIPRRSAFKINSSSNIEIDIIPFGYDWDKVKKINIQV